VVVETDHEQVDLLLLVVEHGLTRQSREAPEKKA
jgi:hypothetical protein